MELEGLPRDEGLGKTEQTPEVVQVLSLIAADLHSMGVAEKGHH